MFRNLDSFGCGSFSIFCETLNNKIQMKIINVGINIAIFIISKYFYDFGHIKKVTLQLLQFYK